MVVPLTPAQAEGARRHVALCRAVLDSPPAPPEAHGRVAVRTDLWTRPGPGSSGARGTPDRPGPRRSAVPVAPRLPEPADEP